MSFTGIFAAISSTFCILFVLMESDCTLRAWAMLVPNLSVWIRSVTKLSMSSDIGSHGKILQGLTPHLPCPQLKGEKFQLFAQQGIPQFHFVAYAVDGSVKPHAGLSAYDHQVQGVRKAPDNLVLTVCYLYAEARDQVYKTR